MRVPTDVGRAIRGVFTDIDDTLTDNGRLHPAAFAAMAELQAAGLFVVPVTGRPWGWADQIARQWPCDGVVAENGGLWCWVDDSGKMHTGWAQTEQERHDNRQKLDAAARDILSSVPGTALASDQPFRALDLAIDWCEAVPRLAPPDVSTIVREFHAIGATAKVSSIHVNGWIGDFDKRTGCAQFVAERWNEQLDPEAWAFVGDSGNDEPMFAHFTHSFGVANVVDFLPQMRSKPTWITDARGGLGFAQAAAALLTSRR